jgi:hypothetical protein
MSRPELIDLPANLPSRRRAHHSTQPQEVTTMTNLPDMSAKPVQLDDLNGRVHVHGDVMLAESGAGATPSDRRVRIQRSLAGGLTLYADPITTALYRSTRRAQAQAFPKSA